MKYLILLFIMVNSLYASSVDIIELYRTKGINAVEKEIANQLQTKSYWDFNLKHKEVKNGYYESIHYVMICQKDLKDIKLYDTRTKSQLFNSDVFVGEKKGDKQVEGDLKTPIGAYKLTNRITFINDFFSLSFIFY